MNGAAKSRRAEAEIDAAAAQTGCAGIGSRSIHQFWHLFAAHFRGILLPPRRRPDSGKVAWGWREPPTNPAPTPAELGDVRRRLTQASRALTGTPGQAGSVHEADDDSVDAQVRARVAKMTADLVAKPDHALATFVCRDESGLMLHSWGAATAAAPSYPDNQQTEISGHVRVEDGGSAKLGVLLENDSGLGVARTQTDQAGAFRFQGIAPGRYRLRVANRSDFPADGLAVVLEKAPVTGLELRSMARATPADTTPASRAAAPERRRLAASVLLLLLLAAVAILGWRYWPRAVARATAARTDTGWQSARGDLHASGDGAESEARPTTGTAGAQISAVGPVSAPGLNSRDPQVFAKEDSGTGGRMTAPARRLDETPQADGASRSATLASSDEDRGKAGDSPRPPAAVGVPGRQDMAHDAHLPETAPPDARASAATAVPRVRADGSFFGLGSVDTEDREAPGKPASLAAQRTRADADRPAFSQPGTEGSTAAGAGASASSGAAVSAAANAPSASRAQSAEGGSAEAGDLRARPGPHRPERGGATNSEGTVVATDEQAATRDAAKRSTPPSRAEGSAGAEGRAVDRVADAPPEPRTSERAASVRNPPRPAAAGAVASDGARTSDTTTLKETVEPAQETLTDAASPTDDAAVASGRLTSLGQVSAGAWQPVLVRDEILTTFPVADGRGEPLGPLRAKTQTAREGSMPAALRAAVTWSGFSLDLGTVPGIARRDLRWRDQAGREPEGAIVQGPWTEFAWDSNRPLRSREYRLAGPDGAVLASITMEAGGPVLSAIPGARAAYWVAVGCTPADHFHWQGAPGSAVPSVYEGYGPWRKLRAMRLDFPLQSAAHEPDARPVALVDDASGWSLSCLIRTP